LLLSRLFLDSGISFYRQILGQIEKWKKEKGYERKKYYFILFLINRIQEPTLAVIWDFK